MQARMRSNNQTISSSSSRSSSKKGQGTLASFFAPAKGKENENMGLSSNLRKSAIKKLKQHAASHPKKKQKTIMGGDAAGHCDEGTKTCEACKRLEKNPNFKSFAHDVTCPCNARYSKSDGGRITEKQMLASRLDELRHSEITRPPKGAEVHTLEHRATQEDVHAFLQPRQIVSVQAPPEAPVQSRSEDSVLPTDNIAADVLKKEIGELMSNPSRLMGLSKSAPNVAGAAVEVLLKRQNF